MYQITGECIGCGMCQSMCPKEAVSMGAEQRENDWKTCIQCRNCFEGCLVEATKER